jgi:hypothetical protein
VSTRLRVITLVALFSVVLAGCGGEPEPTATPMGQVQIGPGGPILPGLTSGRQVMAPDGRYAVFVPADWIEIGSGIAEVTYRSPDLEAAMTVSIARERLAEIRRAQAYAEAGRRSVSAVWTDVITLTMTPVQVGDVHAYRWLYTATVSGAERLVYQLYIVDGNEGFVLTGFAPIDSDFAQSQATFDAIAGSISFGVG